MCLLHILEAPIIGRCRYALTGKQLVIMRESLTRFALLSPLISGTYRNIANLNLQTEQCNAYRFYQKCHSLRILVTE